MPSPQPVPLSWSDHAARMLEEGDWPGLEYAARQILRADPGSAFGYRCLGIALFNRGSIVEALNAHQRSVDLAPRGPDLWYDFAVTLLKAEQRAPAGAQRQHQRHAAEEKLLTSLDLDPAYWSSYRAILTLLLGEAGQENEDIAARDQARRRCNEIFTRYSAVFPPRHTLLVDVTLFRRTITGPRSSTAVLEVALEDGQVIIRNDSLRIDAAGDTFWQAVEEFLSIHGVLYEEFVETGEPLSESGHRYAELLRFIGAPA